jgi:saccharopine dehydrogenase (NADP+, L-glutamate forming)
MATREVVVIGAGQSSPFLIRHLLDSAAERGWRVRVADRDAGLAAERVAGHPSGEALGFDVNDSSERDRLIGAADAVVNLLPQSLQPVVARSCVGGGAHMFCASYLEPETRALHAEAEERGLLLLAEIGLDPGIDHMSTMALIDRIHGAGGVVESFESYGSGVPAPDSIDNPLGYAITWNPRNVVMAAEHGAHYLRNGELKILPMRRVFGATWEVEVEGVGTMEAYANRDSMAYKRTFGLDETRTLVRGTLRYPGFCETWLQVVSLGLTTERFTIPHLGERSFRELVEMFLPGEARGLTTEERFAALLGLDLDGRAMSNLSWLGLFSPEPIGAEVETLSGALAHLLQRRLRLPPGGRDMIVLMHDLVVSYHGRPGRERVTSTLVEYGERGGTTAMARTVGLPAALATRAVLDGELDQVGCHIPTDRTIYEPLLAELEREGVCFRESVTPIADRARLPVLD